MSGLKRPARRALSKRGCWFGKTASYWAGPFEGNYAFYRLADMRDMPGSGPLPTEAELRQHSASATKTCPADPVTIRTAGPK